MMLDILNRLMLQKAWILEILYFYILVHKYLVLKQGKKLYDNGIYYGYVQPTNDTINIEKNFNEKKNNYANNVLVVFVATSDKYGQVVAYVV